MKNFCARVTDNTVNADGFDYGIENLVRGVVDVVPRTN